MDKVTIDQGTLVGGRYKTANNFELIEFLQIPYAKPPLGDLRFKSPQAPESWEGERDATSVDKNHLSFQFDIMKNTLAGTEDCLYLNVYTPRLPTAGSKSLPVMVYIHGGGFVCGNGIVKEEGGPDFLIENDVVVVAINYRLGVFGFLSLDIPEAAGNMGLKDQVMALKWIQQNISKFGGDKDNVTILGISAGSASVEYLILSPVSEGLFHKAILQSGSALNHWAINYNIKDLSVKLVQELGYQGSCNDDHGMYEYLCGQSTDAIGQVAHKISNFSTAKGIYFGFVPSIEKDFGDAFLTEYPYNLLKEGRFHKVPVIKGFCEFEGLLVSIMKRQDIEEVVQNKRFLDYWSYPLNPNDSDEYNAKFIKAYLDEKNNDDDEELFAVNFFGDFDFTSGVWISSKVMAEKIPIYVYMFAYDGSLSIMKAMSGGNKKGACHGDDFAYTMNFVLPTEIKPSETDKIIVKRIAKMWTDFSKTGDPTPNTSELIPLRWPTFNADEQNYLVIDKYLEVKSNYKPNRIEIYEEIYEKYRK